MAKLDLTNNYLQTLINAANDAQSNLYVANFSGGNLDNFSTALSVRCDKFTIPQTEQTSYDVKFITSSIPKPRAKVNVTHNFTLTFRVDSNFKTYKALLDQQQITFNAAQSFAATNLKSLEDSLFNVTVDAVVGGMDSEKTETSTICKFKKCWISKITPISFKQDSSDPATVEMTINFLEMNDLQSGF